MTRSRPAAPASTSTGRPNTSGRLASHAPTLVLTCGFAGGLNPELTAGAVVFATDDVPLRKKLAAAGARPARFYCTSHIATTAAEKQELRRSTAADAVEMESEAIHAVCREQGISCGTVRVILSGLEGRRDMQECRLTRVVQGRKGSLGLRVLATPLVQDHERFTLLAVAKIAHRKR